MASINHEGISGAIGNIVFYTMNGKKYARSVPNLTKKRRKELSQAPQATVFGLVSQYGTPMIRMLQELLLFPFTLVTYNMARGWMRGVYNANHAEPSWSFSGRYDKACSLNAAAIFPEALKTAVQVTDTGKGKIKVLVEEMNLAKYLKLPPHIQKVNIKLMAVSAPFSNTLSIPVSCMEQYSFHYKKAIFPAQEILLKTKGNAGDIVIIVMALEFDLGNGYSRDARHLPAGIVAMGRLE